MKKDDLLIQKFVEEVTADKGNKAAQKILIADFAKTFSYETIKKGLEPLFSLVDSILTTPEFNRDERKKCHEPIREWLITEKNESCLLLFYIEVLGYPESKAQCEIIEMIEMYCPRLWEKALNGTPQEQAVCGLDGIYTDETLEAIFDRLVKEGWFIGEKSHFVAIFKPDPLPVGWKPIEYTKMNGKTHHQSALAALVYLIYPKVKAGYVWSGFTVEGETFEIVKDRDSYKQLETLDLKGIDLKLK